MKTRIISGLIMAPLLVILYFGGWRIMSLQCGDDGAAWVEKLNKAAEKGKQPVKQPVVSNKKGAVKKSFTAP